MAENSAGVGGVLIRVKGGRGPAGCRDVWNGLVLVRHGADAHPQEFVILFAFRKRAVARRQRPTGLRRGPLMPSRGTGMAACAE
jgi:hypothetical protein